jgi:hypothetical protein
MRTLHLILVAVLFAATPSAGAAVGRTLQSETAAQACHVLESVRREIRGELEDNLALPVLVRPRPEPELFGVDDVNMSGERGVQTASGNGDRQRNG